MNLRLSGAKEEDFLIETHKTGGIGIRACFTASEKKGP